MATTTGTTVGINKWFTGPSMWLIYGILMKNGPGIVSLWKPKIQWILWIVYHSIKAPHHEYQYDLVGGFNPSEKYSSSWSIIPNIWKNKNHVPNHQSVIKYWYPDESWAILASYFQTPPRCLLRVQPVHGNRQIRQQHCQSQQKGGDQAACEKQRRLGEWEEEDCQYGGLMIEKYLMGHLSIYSVYIYTYINLIILDIIWCGKPNNTPPIRMYFCKVMGDGLFSELPQISHIHNQENFTICI